VHEIVGRMFDVRDRAVSVRLSADDERSLFKTSDVVAFSDRRETLADYLVALP
jgi:hypothetical protein